MRRPRPGHPAPPSPDERPKRATAVDRWRGVAACAGALALAGSFAPWLDRAAENSFAWHMAQHMLLVYAAAPLLLLAWPARTVLRTLPAVASRRLARAMHAPWLIAVQHPVIAWLFFATVLWGVHFSPLYEDSLVHPGAHVVEHALLFGAALLFWQPVIRAVPAPWRLAYPLRMAYVIVAVPVGAFLGLALVQTTHVLYPHYAAAQGSVAAAIADQRTGGALMWIGGGLVLFAAFMFAAAAWARDERRLAERLDAKRPSVSVIPIARGALLRRRLRDRDVEVRQ